MAQVSVQMVSLAEREAQILRQVEKGNTAAMNVIASAVVDLSPVDTATYITSHVIYEGSDLGSIPALFSSEGRDGGQDRGAYEGVALAKMSALIENLDHSQPAFMFGNEAEHRYDVEYTHAYRVFQHARAALPEAVQAARLAVLPSGGV